MSAGGENSSYLSVFLRDSILTGGDVGEMESFMLVPGMHAHGSRGNPHGAVEHGVLGAWFRGPAGRHRPDLFLMRATAQS